MIYVDTSVALAHLFGEELRQPDAFWGQKLATSRLLELEVWTRVRARGGPGEAAVDGLLSAFAFVEITPETTSLIRRRLPLPVRTLDAIHLAAADYLRGAGAPISIATYDHRLAEAATRLGFSVV